MSPIGDGGWRIHYLGPWTWHTHGHRDGWGFPQRHWGWRLIITARRERLDVRGKLLDVLEAGLYFPNLKPVGDCGRDNCHPGDTGGTVDVHTFITAPCHHPQRTTIRPDDCACGNELRPGLHIKGPGAMCNPDFPWSDR